MKKNVKKIILSPIMQDVTATRKITYIAIMTALQVICNMFFEIKLAETQYSLTIFFSVFTGMIIGPFFGFVACFLGDLVGFLYNSAGFAYMPWIGLAMGMTALISGLIMNGIRERKEYTKYIKLLVVCVLVFLVCTIAINTTAFWVLYAKGVPYFTYVISRVFVMGQIWNSLLNYGLLFICYPIMQAIITQLQKRRKG